MSMRCPLRADLDPVPGRGGEWESEEGGLGGDRVLFLGRGSRKLDALSLVLLILTLFLFRACREGVLCPFLVSIWRGVDACSCFACG